MNPYTFYLSYLHEKNKLILFSFHHMTLENKTVFTTQTDIFWCLLNTWGTFTESFTWLKCTEKWFSPGLLHCLMHGTSNSFLHFCTHSISLLCVYVHVISDYYLFLQFAVYHIISCTKFQKQLHCFTLTQDQFNIFCIGGKTLFGGYIFTAFNKSQTMYCAWQYIFVTHICDFILLF